MKPKKRGVCVWGYDEDYDYFETDCGETQCFTEGGIEDNHYKCCPFCGKPIKEVR